MTKNTIDKLKLEIMQLTTNINDTEGLLEDLREDKANLELKINTLQSILLRVLVDKFLKEDTTTKWLY